MSLLFSRSPSSCFIFCSFSKSNVSLVLFSFHRYFILSSALGCLGAGAVSFLLSSTLASEGKTSGFTASFSGVGGVSFAPPSAVLMAASSGIALSSLGYWFFWHIIYRRLKFLSHFLRP